MINKIFSYFYEREQKPVKWKPLDAEVYAQFKVQGEGLYLVFLVAGQNVVSRAIRFFTGKYSHVVMVWNTIMIENSILLSIDRFQYQRLYLKTEKYYINSPITSIKLLVMASMDDTGANYFDFSKYNTRKFDIVKLDFLTPDQEKIIIDKFLTPEVMDLEYDYTGLPSWIVNFISPWLYKKFFDDKKRYLCSEVYPEIFNQLGITICDIENPSPQYLYNWLIFYKKSLSLILKRTI